MYSGGLSRNKPIKIPEPKSTVLAAGHVQYVLTCAIII